MIWRSRKKNTEELSKKQQKVAVRIVYRVLRFQDKFAYFLQKKTGALSTKFLKATFIFFLFLAIAMNIYQFYRGFIANQTFELGKPAKANVFTPVEMYKRTPVADSGLIMPKRD